MFKTSNFNYQINWTGYGPGPQSYHGDYKRVRALIKPEMKAEDAQVQEKSPKRPVAKSMVEALRKTAESLK